MGRRAWLENSLIQDWIPRLRALEDNDAGRAEAEAINRELQTWWSNRGLTTLSQQQGPMDITRRYLKTYLGPDHFCLNHINFTTQQWIQLNIKKQKAVAERNENVQFIDQPDKIVAQAVRLLEKPAWADVCAGLAVLTGRRSSELLSTAKFEKKTQWSVTFTGALKRRGELQELSFEIPTLTTADRVIAALAKVRHELPQTAQLDAATVNERFGRAVQESCDRFFAHLVPKREGKDSLYTHLFRCVYATIATFWYCPPNVNETEFKAAIQGHYAVMDVEDPELQRSLAASRHYSDYEIADTIIAQYGGRRKGIKLGHGGIKPIEVFAPARAQHRVSSSREQPSEKAMKMSRMRVTEQDRSSLEQFFDVLGFEGNQAEQMSLLVDWIRRQLRGAQPSPQAHPELEAPPAPSLPQIEELLPPPAAPEPEPEILPGTPTPQLDAQIEAQLEEREQPVSSTLEDKIGGLIDVMQQFISLQLVQHAGPQKETTPVAAPPTPSASVFNDSREVTQSPRAAISRGSSERIINEAIDAIMAFNDSAERYDDKWAITINVLKSFVKSQRKIQQILDHRTQEIQAHHRKHQIDPAKQNYKHRGQNVLDCIQRT